MDRDMLGFLLINHSMPYFSWFFFNKKQNVEFFLVWKK